MTRKGSLLPTAACNRRFTIFIIVRIIAVFFFLIPGLRAAISSLDAALYAPLAAGAVCAANELTEFVLANEMLMALKKKKDEQLKRGH